MLNKQGITVNKGKIKVGQPCQMNNFNAQIHEVKHNSKSLIKCDAIVTILT